MFNSKKVVSCVFCNSSKLEAVLDLGKQPPANSLRKDLNEKLIFKELKLLFCKCCNLVQLSEIIDPSYLFKDYVWVTGTADSTIKYSKNFFERILKKTKIKEKSLVVEIASNDGTFLKHFKKNNFEVLGIDPAVNIASIANNSGIKTLPKFFNEKLALDLAKSKKADLIIARNVIPHVKDIHPIIKGISLLMNDDGIGVIEFHYIKEILEELHYDSIYHEHLYYFSIKTIQQFLNKYGLYVFDVMKSPISGGSLVLFFSKSKLKKSAKLENLISYETKNKLNDLETWKSFAIRSIDHSSKLRKVIDNIKNSKKVYGYGASARSSTLLNFCKIDNSSISVIFDQNPLKHGMFTPGTDIEIRNPTPNEINILDNPTIVILAWNFKNEIITNLKNMGFKGKVIIPLPNKVKLYEV